MFNDRFGLTQAVLEGIKTQTRILVPNVVFTLQWDIREMPDGMETICVENTYGEFVDIRDTEFSQYKIGEVVAIAQCYKELYPNADFEMVGNGLMTESAGWNNKMFVQANLMKHHIQIADLKVERLQDISDEDILREGIQKVSNDTYMFKGCEIEFHTPREAFVSLIDKVIGIGIWEINPWVEAYSLELID